MNKNKIISGVIGVVVGCLIFTLMVNLISKPDNEALFLNPMESFKTYFFSFGFALGTLGYILGTLILLGLISGFYFLGTWMYKTIVK